MAFSSNPELKLRDELVVDCAVTDTNCEFGSEDDTIPLRIKARSSVGLTVTLLVAFTLLTVLSSRGTPFCEFAGAKQIKPKRIAVKILPIIAILRRFPILFLSMTVSLARISPYPCNRKTRTNWLTGLKEYERGGKTEYTRG